MRTPAESRRRLARGPPLAGRAPSAFHPMREAAAESPGLPLCADDHAQRQDRPNRSGEKPELRRNAGTRLRWRAAPEPAPNSGTRLAPMSREVRRGLAPLLPSNLLLCGTQNLAVPPAAL